MLSVLLNMKGESGWCSELASLLASYAQVDYGCLGSHKDRNKV